MAQRVMPVVAVPSSNVGAAAHSATPRQQRRFTEVIALVQANDGADVTNGVARVSAGCSTTTTTTTASVRLKGLVGLCRERVWAGATGVALVVGDRAVEPFGRG